MGLPDILVRIAGKMASELSYLLLDTYDGPDTPVIPEIPYWCMPRRLRVCCYIDELGCYLAVFPFALLL